MTDNSFSDSSRTRELQTILETLRIKCPGVENHIPCIVNIIQHALGAFTSSLSVKRHTKSWEAHDCGQHFGENDSVDIGNSQSHGNEGNAIINKVSAMRPGLAKIIEKVWISSNSECSTTDVHIAANPCCNIYADTWSSKRVDWLPNSECTDRSTDYYGFEDPMEYNPGVAWANLPITRIDSRVAQISRMQWLPATGKTSWCMGHPEVHDDICKAIPVQDPVDVKEAYSYSASHYHYPQ